ncbi:hypothetical protein H0H81_009924 [Sphagnurus paluster]|uniref:Uncharacterized protein n=1 Tax=Sphagnurus paluster TaxID=117069 RepID=A0A9P7KNB1_9AGAR|nr:hypothetical protein H0H81_009924 [Sphagnurus paluster]
MFTQALFDLAVRPSYIEALRDEVESVIRDDGLTKLSLHKMRKLDSFIKESQRFGGAGACTSRCVIVIPGRFLAVNQIKALLVHVLLNYDVAFENGTRPADRWYAFVSMPDSSASVMFRKRRG